AGAEGGVAGIICRRWTDVAAVSVRSPPSCGEGLGVGVARLFADRATIISPHHPLPNPPPQGGREKTESAARSVNRLRDAAPPTPPLGRAPQRAAACAGPRDSAVRNAKARSPHAR